MAGRAYSGYHLTKPRKRSFSIVTSTHWNILPSEIRLACSLLAFHKHLGTFVWTLRNEVEPISWFRRWMVRLYPATMCFIDICFFLILCLVSTNYFIISELGSHKSEMNSYINQPSRQNCCHNLPDFLFQMHFCDFFFTEKKCSFYAFHTYGLCIFSIKLRNPI